MNRSTTGMGLPHLEQGGTGAGWLVRSRVPIRLAVELRGEQRSTGAREYAPWIGEEAQVANTDETLGEQMKQEATERIIASSALLENDVTHPESAALLPSSAEGRSFTML